VCDNFWQYKKKPGQRLVHRRLPRGYAGVGVDSAAAAGSAVTSTTGGGFRKLVAQATGVLSRR
jgi:hypothetical protein